MHSTLEHLNIYKANINILKWEIGRNTIIVVDFDKPLPIMDRSFKQKINKDTLDLNNKLHQMELTDIHRTFYPLVAEYIFFSSVHGTFFRIDHMLGHKTSLNKFKKTEIHTKHIFQLQCYKIRNQYKRKTRKFTNMWRLNNMILNNQGS